MVPEFKSWQPRMWRGKYIILCDIMFTHEDFLRRHWQGLEELERALWRRWSLELVRSSEGLEKRREEKTSRFCSKNEFARCGELWGEEPARADGTRQAANRLKNQTAGKRETRFWGHVEVRQSLFTLDMVNIRESCRCLNKGVTQWK